MRFLYTILLLHFTIHSYSQELKNEIIGDYELLEHLYPIPDSGTIHVIYKSHDTNVYTQEIPISVSFNDNGTYSFNPNQRITNGVWSINKKVIR